MNEKIGISGINKLVPYELQASIPRVIECAPGLQNPGQVIMVEPIGSHFLSDIAARCWPRAIRIWVNTALADQPRLYGPIPSEVYDNIVSTSMQGGQPRLNASCGDYNFLGSLPMVYPQGTECPTRILVTYGSFDAIVRLNGQGRRKSISDTLSIGDVVQFPYYTGQLHIAPLGINPWDEKSRDMEPLAYRMLAGAAKRDGYPVLKFPFGVAVMRP
jgi:hypothetical protein